MSEKYTSYQQHHLEMDKKYLINEITKNPKFIPNLYPGTTMIDNPYTTNGPTRQEMGLPVLTPAFK